MSHCGRVSHHVLILEPLGFYEDSERSLQANHICTPRSTLQLCANISVALKKHFAEEEEMDSAFLNSQAGKLARLRNFL